MNGPGFTIANSTMTGSLGGMMGNTYNNTIRTSVLMASIGHQSSTESLP